MRSMIAWLRYKLRATKMKKQTEDTINNVLVKVAVLCVITFAICWGTAYLFGDQIETYLVDEEVTQVHE